MGRKIVDITHCPSKLDILSQTPKNYSKDNYFLKELQDKVNAEWIYRPNRATVEYENVWGEQSYSPIEVVTQTVKSDSGKEIANDVRRIVFRDIFEERFSIGSKFRMNLFPLSKTIQYKSDPKSQPTVWLATNMDSAQLTSSVVVERCAEFLGSLFVDDQGVSTYHYEPVIIQRDLNDANFVYFNMTDISMQSRLVLTAQYNKYTERYFVNQRFIIGNHSVYRVVAINDAYSNETFDSKKTGLIKIYIEVVEKSEKDDFVNRIAYQPGVDHIPVIVNQQDSPGKVEKDEYSIIFESPSVFPTMFDSDYTTFVPKLVKNGTTVIPDIEFGFNITLENLPSSVDISNYLLIENIEGGVKIKRKRVYMRGASVITWTVPSSVSPTGEDIVTSFKIKLN